MMKKFLLTVLIVSAIPPWGFAYSSDVQSDMSEIRSIAQSIVIHAAENGETISIPYEEIPSVQRSVATLKGGNIAFSNHETFVFPPAEPVPVVFFERIGWVLIGLSDGDVRYFKKSEPPQFWPFPTLTSVAWKGFVKISPWLSLMLFALLLKLWFFPKVRSIDQ